MDAMAFHILCSFEIAVNSSFKIQDFTYSHYAMIVPNLHEKKTAIGNQREAYVCLLPSCITACPKCGHSAMLLATR